MSLKDDLLNHMVGILNQLPFVLIVVLNHNQKEDTIECLDALILVKYINCKIVVIDNHSSDGSQKTIKAKFPDIELIELPTNLGCAGGRNIGYIRAKELKPDYILFLDNDTVVEQDFLDELVAVAESDSQIGIVGSVILKLDNMRVWMAGGNIYRFAYAESLFWDVELTQIPSLAFDVAWVPGCVMLIRYCIVNKIGFFDERYFIYFEDIDWCIRTLNSGYTIRVAPRSIVKHKVSRSLGGVDSPTKCYYMTRNYLLFRFTYTRFLGKIFTFGQSFFETMKAVIADISTGKKAGNKRAVARLRGLADYCTGKYYEVHL